MTSTPQDALNPGLDGELPEETQPGQDWQPRSVAEICPELEAILLVSAEPIPTVTLAQAVRCDQETTLTALAHLADEYTSSGRGFQLRETGGGWRLATRPEYHELLARWVVESQQNRLSQAGLETIAVIAYLQPTTRSRVGAVRGVNVESAVRTLLGQGLIAESGTDPETGAALLVTTDYFLERAGLRSLDELPPIAPLLPEAAALEAELRELTQPTPAEETAETSDTAASEADPAPEVELP